MIPSILSSRTERRWHIHSILGFCEEWRIIIETSAGVRLTTEWCGSESEAIMDSVRLKHAARQPLAA